MLRVRSLKSSGVMAAALLLALLCFVSSTAAQPTIDKLTVRTIEGAPQLDVVTGGNVADDWKPNNPKILDQATFPVGYVLFLEGAEEEVPYTLTYSPARPDFVGTFDADLKPATVESGMVGGTEVRTTIQTRCVGQSIGVPRAINVTLEILGTTLQWKYKKECIAPQISAGTVSYGNDAVESSMAQEQFANWVVTDDSLVLYWFLENDPDEGPGDEDVFVPFDLSITSLDPNVVNVDMGQVTFNSTTPDDSQKAIYDVSQPIGMMAIPFQCVRPDILTQAQLVLTIDYHWINILQVTTKKQCGQGKPLELLTIGTAMNMSDIAEGGVVHTEYLPPQGYVYGPDNLDYGNIFDFFFCQGCEGGGIEEGIAWNLTYDQPTTNVFVITTKGKTTGVLMPGHYQRFAAQVDCINDGQATVMFQLDFLDYEIAPFAFTYSCIMPLLDVAYGADPYILAVNQTVVKPDWSEPMHTIPAEENQSEFWIYLDEATHPMILHQYYILSFDLDNNYMKQPTIDDPQWNSATTLPNEEPIKINWRCKKSTPDNMHQGTPVIMNIAFGWSHEVISISFNKICVVEAPADNPGGGWSAAGIFFFTLFILGLVLFLAGCAFNYFKEGKRGWKMVPGYESAAACFDRMRGTDRRWTPQMNEAVQSSSQYGGLDDTGAHYSSNL